MSPVAPSTAVASVDAMLTNGLSPSVVSPVVLVLSLSTMLPVALGVPTAALVGALMLKVRSSLTS